MKNDATLKNFVSNVIDLIPSTNDTPFKRILAIGDIHGEFTKLMRLWDKIEVTADDKIIFLGDFIDRGAEIAETLEFVIEQSKKPNVVMVRGNHEQMMLEAFRKDREFMDEIMRGGKRKITYHDVNEHPAAGLWLVNDGVATCKALRKLNKESKFTVDEVLDFVEGLSLSHLMTIGERKYFLCHAGVRANVPLDEQDEEDLLWIREECFKHYDGLDVIIVGHTPVQSVFAFDDDYEVRPMRFLDKNILMIDTGSYYQPDGKISCVDILTGEYWQS